MHYGWKLALGIAVALALPIVVHLRVPSVQAQSGELDTLDARVTDLTEAGKYAEAVAPAEQIVALAKKLFGENDREYATAISKLALVLARGGRYREAEPLFKQALEIKKQRLGPDHAEVGECLDRLALFYETTGRLAEAEDFAKQALRNAEAISADDAVVGSRLHHLAIVYTGQGRYQEAKPLFERALKITEVAGVQNRQLAEILSDYALLYQELGAYAEAQSLFERALHIDEALFGPDHPFVGSDRHTLGRLFWAQGRNTEAENSLKQALDIKERTLGPDHPVVANTLGVLARLYRDMTRYGEAERLHLRALSIRQARLGPDNVVTSWSLHDLAALYQELGRNDEAKTLIEQALEIRKKHLGPTHTETARSFFVLGSIHEKRGGRRDLQLAERYYRHALEIQEATLAPDHPDTGRTRAGLGGLYKSLRRYGEAEPLLKSALMISEGVLGSTHPRIAYDLTQLGDLYRLIGKCSEAEPLFLRARTIGAATIAEVPVLFGTDRRRDASQPSGFGNERGDSLSVGLVIVTVPKDETTAAKTALLDVISPIEAVMRARAPEPTEARRLALHCVEVVGEQQVVQAAVRRIGVSKTYPDQALLFVHGFNVSFENALRRAGQIAHDIRFDGGTFLFSWPSRERLWGYLSDSDTVDIAAGHLIEFLKKIVVETKVTKVHFVAHSMGNMVLLRALERLAGDGAMQRPVIGEIVHAAPDVDPDLFSRMVRTIKSKGGNFTLYASRGDLPLRISSWLRGLPRAGFFWDTPLIVSGVETIDITHAGTGLFALNHDVYASSAIIVADMRRTIEKGERPPDEFEPATAKGGTYWRLRQAKPSP